MENVDTKGSIAENFVISELVSNGLSLYYWSKNQVAEIDLIIESDEEEYDNAYEVVFTDGKVETYYSNETPEALEGYIYELTVSGNEITEFEDFDYAGSVEADEEGFKVYYDMYKADEKNGVLHVNSVYDTNSKLDTVDDSFVLSDSVLYIRHKDGEYSVGRESAIDELDTLSGSTVATNYDKDKELLAEATRLESIFTYVDEDGIEEVVAIVYSDDEVSTTTINSIGALTYDDANDKVTAPEIRGLVATVVYGQEDNEVTTNPEFVTITYTVKPGYEFKTSFGDSDLAATSGFTSAVQAGGVDKYVVIVKYTIS